MSLCEEEATFRRKRQKERSKKHAIKKEMRFEATAIAPPRAPPPGHASDAQEDIPWTRESVLPISTSLDRDQSRYELRAAYKRILKVA